ncbi:hypothetical protein UAY_00527 [Enterococcus moraviensis ATCC BAA-383]|uniref:DUF5057 domain-containing protein n=1 Tax=Enterococcus moraviensis ATCC BAA-383 TaxID=1158609 RepID=R2TCK7_9ENTE|nr:hypothetical protein [Enterococcus moraviensis]EOI05053.1 hypothetical protein UAY_00527 [Enterococcus moraviensis ATCC BAA-383]EOT63836.1 hypothetical protein I586_03269 [Enterococcus moraviensis ATCC BAA-383]
MRKQKRKLNIKTKFIGVFLCITLVAISSYLIFYQDKLTASTIVVMRDFRLKAENRWSGDDKKSFAYLEWDNVKDIDKTGYQLYQSEDGNSWSVRSLNYGKAIKVLNIYPDLTSSNNLKVWMDSLDLKNSKGEKLINVDASSQRDYSANPNKYLKNAQGEYQYDVIMFGSWDYNNHIDISVSARNATQAFIDSGRGVLFGHDTITPNDRSHTNFNSFASQLGLKLQAKSFQLGSRNVKITNNGYLMKYPFELQNDLDLTIPLTHTWGQGILPNATTTKWLEFKPPYNWNKPGDGSADATFYLATNNNLGMIQTGHSNGTSTPDERKIIANTLYNLAQVSFETTAQDQTVKDDQAPSLATAIQKPGGSILNFDIEVDSVDKGKEYQWFIEANTKSNGLKRSDIVKENITSNIAGYFYTIDTLATSPLKETVEGYKDAFGRISASLFDIYIAPTGETNSESPTYDPTKDANLVNYNTKGTIKGINGITDLEKYLHIVTVDRSNNVSGIKTVKIKELMNDFRVLEQYVDTEGAKIKPDSYQDIQKNNSYEKKIESIDKYVIDSYKINNENNISATSDGKVMIEQVNDHHTVTYYYNKLIQLNIRQIVLTGHNELIVPNKGYVQLDNGQIDKKSNVFHVSVNSGEESENIPYSPIQFAKTGKHDQLAVSLMIPEYYRYSGYIMTENDRPHDSMNKVSGEMNIDINGQGNYWLTIYLEPAIGLDTSPTPYSWSYKQNQLGEISLDE